MRKMFDRKLDSGRRWSWRKRQFPKTADHRVTENFTTALYKPNMGGNSGNHLCQDKTVIDCIRLTTSHDFTARITDASGKFQPKPV